MLICQLFLVTRIANANFHLSAFARFPVSHGTINYLSMIDGTTYLIMDSIIELNDYYQFHWTISFVDLISILYLHLEVIHIVNAIKLMKF